MKQSTVIRAAIIEYQQALCKYHLLHDNVRLVPGRIDVQFFAGQGFTINQLMFRAKADRIAELFLARAEGVRKQIEDFERGRDVAENFPPLEPDLFPDKTRKQAKSRRPAPPHKAVKPTEE